MKNIYSLNEEAYERDLEAISQKRRFVSDWDKDFDKCFPNARFDYIVMEKPNDKLLDLMLLLKLLERLKGRVILSKKCCLAIMSREGSLVISRFCINKIRRD